jgi:rubrerythrin
MNMFRAFIELDRLTEDYLDRDSLIYDIKKAGYNYKFDKYSDAQLYRMWQKLQHQVPQPVIGQSTEIEETEENFIDREYCEICGTEVNPLGQCPICDLGDDLGESASKEAFANNIDTDILNGLSSEIPEKPILGGMLKCSKSAPLNALYFVSQGEEVTFKLGNISLPAKQITHCWVEHNGEIAQTRHNSDGSDLITKFSIDLLPNDLAASKKLIADLIKSINDDTLVEGRLDYFTLAPKASNWVQMNVSSNISQNSAEVQAVNSNQQIQSTKATGPYIVTIMYDGNKLRARADDGIHGRANVAFPNHLRNHNGQRYEVETLTWNGKNYRASGTIKPVNSVINTQSINENFNKENYEMNFQTILEELDKLYEEDLEKNLDKKVAAEEKVEDDKVEEKEALTEAAEDEEILVDEEPIVDDETAAEETVEEAEELEEAQLVLECENCGAITLKAEADVKVDEETDLANIEEKCQYCEEAKGYKIVGTVMPYEGTEEDPAEDPVEDAEDLEELFDANVKLDAENFGGDNNVVGIGGIGRESLDAK